MNYPHVSIIILNWNGSEDTVECLESVYKIKYPNYNIILLDNASNDESLEKIRGYLEGKIKVKSPFFEYARNKPLKFREYLKNEIESLKNRDNHYLNKELILIKNDKNYGFTEGNNIGIRYALNTLNSDYILLLNN
jgi:GT2 family glycosyltransferase